MLALKALFLNILFVLACLVGFEATLTLPGIAGIVLTVGMAIDGNIIIFERIKEEIDAGTPAREAVETGFCKGLSGPSSTRTLQQLWRALCFSTLARAY